MNWKTWTQLLVALVIVGLCVYIGKLILPVVQSMTPVIGWTLSIVIVVVLVSLGLGVPAAIFLGLRALHLHHTVREIEARKLPVTERGFIGGYISRREQIVVPQITAHSVEVPGHVHIQQEDGGHDAATVARMVLAAAKDLHAGRLLPAPAEAPVQVPPACTFSQVLTEFHPTADRLLIGYLPGRELATSTASELCHVALAGATGGGKCLAWDEPVFLADGRIVKAQDLIGQSVQVIGVTDTQTMQQVPVLATFTENGVRKVFEIELDSGVLLRRTGEHPLWAAFLDENQHVGRQSNGKAMRRTRALNAGWVPAKDLRVCGNRPHFDRHVVLCSTRLHQQGQVKKSDHDVVLCAALLAEGTLRRPGRTPGFTNADAPMVALVSAAANSYGCELVSDKRQVHYRIAKIERTKKGKPRSSGNPIAQLVREWDMNGLATQKTVPLWVFQLPDEQIALFLRVFIDCDGWFDDGTNSYPRVNVALANPVLVQQIGQLALRLGIRGTHRTKSNGHAGCWIWSTSQVDLWQERIGSLVKAEKLAHAVAAKHGMDKAAATEWKAWRDARPTDGQTFADCPDGYEWHKVVAIRHMTAPTVNIEVQSENHAFVGYAVEHNSSLIRLLVAQLCYVGAAVLLLNPHYTRYDLDSGEDWTPFEPYLYADPMQCKDYRAIGYYLQHVAEVMLPARLEKYARSQPVGAPFYLVLDELPAIVKHVPDAPGWMADILREGRKVKLFLVTAAQDFLVKTVMGKEGGGAVRDCFRTAVYVGGDPTTARVLLDVKGSVDDGGLGRGVVLLRSAQVKRAAFARVPYVDNDSLYRLLGPSTYVQAASDATQTLKTPRQDWDEDDSDDRPDAVIVEADPPEMEPLQERPANVRPFPTMPVEPPVTPTQQASEQRPRYTLTDREIDEFIAAYRASGNKDKALHAIGKGSNYREAAERVIQVYALRREEA